MKKKIGSSLLIIVIVIQFFRIDKTNPEVTIANDFIEMTNPPEEITSMLKSSCYDCHSNESNYPWYSNVAPISWWVKDHIDEGRDELNFSEWGTFKAKRKDHKLEEAVEMLEEGEMPLNEYTWTHSEAKLTVEQKSVLVDWLKETRKAAKEKKKEKTLQLNDGEKWLSNPETTAGIERMIALINEEVKEDGILPYQLKGEALNAEMKIIFSKCTMHGEAHEQLHLFLIPLVKEFRQLEEAESKEEAIVQQENILSYLNKYATYFESE